jgi:Zn-dependent protease with chaperone function
MDLTSLYLRTFFGARAFASSELDALAQRMGVLGRLSPDRNDRYFVVGAERVAAANMGNKVVFGRRYYDSLNDEQRLAVGAHEFAHLLSDNNERLKIATSSLAASVIVALFAFISLHSVLLAEIAFLGSFLPLMGILTSRDSRRNMNEELECDRVAVTYVNGPAMISSIRMAGVLWARSPRPSKFLSSTVERRASAIVTLDHTK